MSRSAPYFPFYPDDWLDDVNIFDMGLECEGAYIRLLAAMWKKDGYIPDRSIWCCNVLRCRPAKWRKIRQSLLDFGVINLDKNMLSNQRLLKELHFFNEKSQKNARNANKRWRESVKTDSKKPNKINGHDNASALQAQCHTDTDSDTDTKEKEIINKPKKPKFKLPENIDRKLWNEWMKVRLAKKAVNSDTAKNALLKKLAACAESGTTENDAIIIAIENSWKSIQPDWLQNIKSGSTKPATQKQEYKYKPSPDFAEENPSFDENILDGEFKRLSL